MKVRSYFLPFLTILILLVSLQQASAQYTNNGSFMNESGNIVPYSNYEGEIVVLEAIQTTCPACKNEDHRAIMKELYVSYASQVTFLVISIRTADTLDDLNEFVRTYSIDAQVGLDQANALFNTYEISSTPTTVILDENGIELNKWIGIQYDIQVYAAALNPYVSTPVTSFPEQFSGDFGDEESIISRIFSNPLVLGGIGIFVLLTIYFRISGTENV